MAAKKCTKCGEIKPLEAFSRRSASKDGLALSCRVCASKAAKAAREANPELFRARGRDYVARNRDKVYAANAARRQTKEYKARMQEYSKGWYEENKDRLKAVRREWYLKNKAEHNARSLSAYYADPDTWRARAVEWIKKNPERYREIMREADNRRRARKAGAKGVWTEADVKERFRLQQGKCAVCRVKLTKSFHRDHIVALASGGSNEPSNLQLLCKSCNSRKHKKDPIRFMQENGYLI